MALFDQEASTYDDWCKTPLGSFVDHMEKELMAQSAKPAAGEKALDLGCGTGIYSIWLSKQGLEVTGIDLSSDMLAKAKEKAEREVLAVQWVQGDIGKLPFDDETFDLVVCNIVLEFVSEPEKAVAEALRVLKKGGRLIAGIIRREGYWGKTYLQKGKDRPDSVFAHAQFYSDSAIAAWSPQHLASMEYGLYVTPEHFTDKQQALELERQLSRSAGKQQAGFIAAKWVK